MGTLVMEVVETEKGWAVLVPTRLGEEFMESLPDLPFRLDREQFGAAMHILKGHLRMAQQKKGIFPTIIFRFDSEGRVEPQLGFGGTALPGERFAEQPGETYNDKCHRLMDEAGMAVVDERFRGITCEHFDRMERALWRLRGLLDLLAACDIDKASEVNWENAADGIRVFADEIYDAWRGLHDEWHKAYAKGLNNEASPTADKQEGEAPGQDS